MTYATVEDVVSGFRELSYSELGRCDALLTEAALIIDSYNSSVDEDAKKVVSCRMIRRVLGDGTDSSYSMPIGSTQGSISALGYAQSWQMSSGSAGELYLSKLEKKMLGIGDKIGSHSPLEDLTDD